MQIFTWKDLRNAEDWRGIVYAQTEMYAAQHMCTSAENTTFLGKDD